MLFEHVELEPADDAARLRQLGLGLERPRVRRPVADEFPQPCAALCEDGRCRIYRERPTRCRRFRCSLLDAVIEGTVPIERARRVIREAQRRVEAVRRGLRLLGDRDEDRPLRQRFARLFRRYDAGAPDRRTAVQYGRLTLAMHRLNFLLEQRFLP